MLSESDLIVELGRVFWEDPVDSQRSRHGHSHRMANGDNHSD